MKFPRQLSDGDALSWNIPNASGWQEHIGMEPQALADWLFSGFFEGPDEPEPVTVWLLPGGRVQ